jgi:hypothetical protein
MRDCASAFFFVRPKNTPLLSGYMGPWAEGRRLRGERKIFTQKRAGLTSVWPGRIESSVALTFCFRFAVAQGALKFPPRARGGVVRLR